MTFTNDGMGFRLCAYLFGERVCVRERNWKIERVRGRQRNSVGDKERDSEIERETEK